MKTSAEIQKKAVELKCNTALEIESLKVKREKIMHKNIMEELELAGKHKIKIFMRGRDYSSTKL